METPLLRSSSLANSVAGIHRILVFAVAPPLLYCIVLLNGLGGSLPHAGPWMLYMSLAAGFFGFAFRFAPPRISQNAFVAAEVVVRYALVLLLALYAINKLVPGQFLLYNRDLDLPLREVPARRIAWHFLGHSKLYNGFVAGVELLASLLLCSRRTVVAGTLLSCGALVNVVVIDLAFGLRGALPIATTMMCAALVLAALHVDRQVMRSVLWRHPVPTRRHAIAARLIWLTAVIALFGVVLRNNLGTRRSLGGLVPAAGRWEVVDCTPNPGIPMCPASPSSPPAVMYTEVGLWGQLVAGRARRDLSYTYDLATGRLEARIAADSKAAELALVGTVRDADTLVVLRANGANLGPFNVRLRRTHRAPWPPVRAY